MRTHLRSRLGRASAAIAVGIVTLVGIASTADAHDWRYHHGRYHHWNRGNGWALNNGYYTGYYPYYHRSWDRGWTWGERYGAPPPYAYYQAPAYYPPTFGLMVR
jgi:hypothetical protein